METRSQGRETEVLRGQFAMLGVAYIGFPCGWEPPRHALRLSGAWDRSKGDALLRLQVGEVDYGHPRFRAPVRSSRAWRQGISEWLERRADLLRLGQVGSPSVLSPIYAGSVFNFEARILKSSWE